MYIGEIIKQYRTERNLSMDEFARRANMSKGYISMLENNKNPKTKKPITPSLETIKQIASTIGVEINTLIEILDGSQSLKLNLSPIFPRITYPTPGEKHYHVDYIEGNHKDGFTIIYSTTSVIGDWLVNALNMQMNDKIFDIAQEYYSLAFDEIVRIRKTYKEKRTIQKHFGEWKKNVSLIYQRKTIMCKGSNPYNYEYFSYFHPKPDGKFRDSDKNDIVANCTQGLKEYFFEEREPLIDFVQCGISDPTTLNKGFFDFLCRLGKFELSEPRIVSKIKGIGPDSSINVLKEVYENQKQWNFEYSFEGPKYRTLLLIDLYFLLLNDYNIKECKKCGKYFIQYDTSDAEYCNGTEICIDSDK